MGPGLRDIDGNEGSSSHLARKALLGAACLALGGSTLGASAILNGSLSGIESVLVLSGGVFASAFLITLLFVRKIHSQSIATAATTYYTLYLAAGMIVSLFQPQQRSSLFVYLFWFFPLLVFNKLVNSQAVSRTMEKVLIALPLAIQGTLLATGLRTRFTKEWLYVVTASSMSYACYALLLNLVTRYRETYIAERERAESLRIETKVLESISDCFFSLDSDFRLVYLNDAACAEFGVERQAALKQAATEAAPIFFTEPAVEGLRKACQQMEASTCEAENAQLGQWYEMRCFPRPDGVSVYFRNITAAVVARRSLEAAHKRLREQSELLDKAQDAIFVQDLDTRVLYWNKGAERLFGWSSAEAMGRRVGDLFYQTRGEVRQAYDGVVQLGEWTGEMNKRHRDGRNLVVESRCTLLRDKFGKPTSILAINTDVTARKAADARVHNLAYFDVLTGLPNRVLLREKLSEALASSEERGVGALLLVDLDDFKTLNDTSGHHIGDRLLQEVALRILECVRKSDSVSRFGGDVFLVMLEGLSTDLLIAEAEARVVGEKILSACRIPCQLEDYDYQGTVSIGAVLFQSMEDKVDELLKRADLAMYRAKSQGRNTMCFFDPAMQVAAASRAALMADLQRAMQNEEFELYYQPQWNNDGQVIGAEALLRWKHPQRGIVPPNEFIPLAESSGLIVELGAWVLNTACAQLAAWSSRPEMESLSLSVNVSIRQFVDARFVQSVQTTLRESGANPRRLKLEITESFMMEKVHDAIAKMTELRASGVGFSMDDFGTGYSSLSQLKRLPLDQLKIDQSFVRDVLIGAKDESIVRTIVALGRILGLTIVAEGVETREQRAFLQNHGCDLYQGYLLSPAIPIRRFESFVEKTNQLTAEQAAETSF